MILAVSNYIYDDYDVHTNYEMLFGKKKSKEPNVEPSQKNIKVNVEPSQESEEKKIPVYVESSQEYEEKKITVNVDDTKYWKIEAYKLGVQLYFLRS
jgi:hypothetical protein